MEGWLGGCNRQVVGCNQQVVGANQRVGNQLVGCNQPKVIENDGANGSNVSHRNLVPISLRTMRGRLIYGHRMGGDHVRPMEKAPHGTNAYESYKFIRALHVLQ